MKDLLSYAALVTGIISAILWIVSARAKVAPEPDNPDACGLIEASIVIDGADLEATMRKQAIWNSRAAWAAALTAILQTVAATLPAAC